MRPWQERLSCARDCRRVPSVAVMHRSTVRGHVCLGCVVPPAAPLRFSCRPVPSIARGNGTPKGTRTPVSAVRGRRPRPLDDGGVGRSLVTRRVSTASPCRMQARAFRSVTFFCRRPGQAGRLGTRNGGNLPFAMWTAVDNPPSLPGRVPSARRKWSRRAPCLSPGPHAGAGSRRHPTEAAPSDHRHRSCW